MERELHRVFEVSLRRYREEGGLSQKAFADGLGMHRTSVGGVERDERELTLKSAERIAGLFAIDAIFAATAELEKASKRPESSAI